MNEPQSLVCEYEFITPKGDNLEHKKFEGRKAKKVQVRRVGVQKHKSCTEVHDSQLTEATSLILDENGNLHQHCCN